MTAPTIAERLGSFAASVAYEQTPQHVQRRAKACTLHALTVGAAGAVCDLGRRAERTSPGWIDRPDRAGFATSLVTGRWHPLESAAFVNGVQLHARAQEDTHGTFHAGVCVIPAALAAAQDKNCSGTTFLAAVIAGYEAGIALSSRLTELTTPPFRATAAFGPVAAAAAAGRVWGLEPATMTSAVAIAASMSGGTAESFGAGTDEWHFQSGAAAATGLRAAQLARVGVHASRHAFEAPSGYLDCFAPRVTGRDDLADGLGQQWNILGVTFKPYPVCAFNQAPALLATRLHQSGLQIGDIVSIELSMNEREATYPGMPAGAPYTSVANTLMSARFALATALVHGDIAYASLTDFDHPDVLRLVERTTLLPRPDRAPKTAHVRIVMADGSTIEEAIDDSDALLSWNCSEVLDNARRLAAEAQLTRSDLTTLSEAVGALDTAASVHSVVRAALARAAAAV